MKQHKILPPHRIQDGWVYVRLPKVAGRRLMLDIGELIYDDSHAGARIISSRKTEQAVETWEYLQRCKAEGLMASQWHDKWIVGHSSAKRSAGSGQTLRAAYHSYTGKEDTGRVVLAHHGHPATIVIGPVVCPTCDSHGCGDCMNDEDWR